MMNVSRTGTLGALQQLVGKHGGATAPKRKPVRTVPRGKAYGFHRKRRTPGADLGPLAGRPLPKGQLLSDASRQDNFQRELGMNRPPRQFGVPRRSVPRTPR